MRTEEHKPLKDLTTMKIGGTARYFSAVSSVSELAEAALSARDKGVPLIVLGGGSNVLISDGEIHALVVKIEIQGIQWEAGDVVIASAGENWDGLVAKAVQRGLWGIENLSGIPGTVGAAPVQNIGAYGAELKDVLEWVEVFNPGANAVRTLSNAACSLGYRDSLFKHGEGNGLIITRVALRLRKDGKPNIGYKDLKNCFEGKPSPSLAEIRDAVLEIRSKKFPDLRTTGTAGSFFKNPIIPKAQFDDLKKKYPKLPGFELFSTSYPLPSVKVPLAWILDNVCNMKGLTSGSVGLFHNQPIVLVNLGGASADEVNRLAERVIKCVKEKTGIEIEWEVQGID